MQVSNEWLQRYEKVRHLLVSPVDFSRLFSLKELDGCKLFILDMGEVNFPTGKILARDPLVYLSKDEKPYFKAVPKGVYRLETLVAQIRGGSL